MFFFNNLHKLKIKKIIRSSTFATKEEKTIKLYS